HRDGPSPCHHDLVPHGVDVRSRPGSTQRAGATTMPGTVRVRWRVNMSIRGRSPRAIPEDGVDPTRLFERASQGDHEAFGMLVGEHLARLDSAARLILRDPELARDAVQEATLRAWRNLRGLRDPAKLGAWLHRLTVNACLDIARKRRGRLFEVELTPLHDAPVADPTSRIANALYVERMLAAIDPAQRAVVVLHFYLDLTLPETAAALGIPV